MKSKQKQIVVFGLGLFGSSLAVNLCKQGCQVMAVDVDTDLVDKIAPYVTQAVAMDATDEETLEGIGIRNFDMAFIAIGANTRDSILVSVLCKEAGIPYVAAKATDDLHAKILRKIGVDRVIFPERDMGMRVAQSVMCPGMLDLLELSDGYQIAEIAVPLSWVGKTLVEVNVRKNYGISVVGIRRGSKFEASPGADSKFFENDVLLVMGKEEQITRWTNKGE